MYSISDIYAFHTQGYTESEKGYFHPEAAKKCLKVLRQLVLGLELLDVGTQMLILLRYMRSAMNRNVNTESLRLGEAFSDKLKEIYMDKVSETARQDVTG